MVYKKTKHKKKNPIFFIFSLIFIIVLFLIIFFNTTNTSKRLSSNTKAFYKPSLKKTINYVMNGTDAVAGEFPFMVDLYFKSTFFSKSPDLSTQHFCGGVLINKNWILTAAHCADRYSKVNIGVAFNVLNLKDKVDKNNLRTVSKMIIHEDYKPKLNEVNPNDIALLKLNKSFETATPINLSQSNISTYNYSGTILGWGYKSNSNKALSNVLQKGEVTYDYYSDNKVLVSSTSTKPFSYDSGGPLIAKLNGVFYDIGVISQTYEDSDPAYYSNIELFIKWIEDKTGLNF